MEDRTIEVEGTGTAWVVQYLNQPLYQIKTDFPKASKLNPAIYVLTNWENCLLASWLLHHKQTPCSFSIDPTS